MAPDFFILRFQKPQNRSDFRSAVIGFIKNRPGSTGLNRSNRLIRFDFRAGFVRSPTSLAGALTTLKVIPRNAVLS